MTTVMSGVIGRLGILLRAAAALVVILALAAGVPWLLAATIGNPIPADGWSWSQPLTNEALLGLLAVLAWLFWAQMMLCLIVEIGAELRLAAGRSADWLTQVPGTFGGQQHLARVLVQAVVAVGIGAGIATAPIASVARAAPVDHLEPAASEAQSAAVDVSAATMQTGTGVDPQHTRTVEVTKGDTLWSIAERFLDSGEHWRRIADLNEGRLMPDGQRFVQASSIQPGWQLLIPSPRGHSATLPRAGMTVLSGDTLWGLAEEAYGDGEDWTRIYDANRDQVADPDLIYPSQVLTVPVDDVSSADPVADPKQPDEAEHPSHPTAPDLPEASPLLTEPTEAFDIPSTAVETTPTSPEHTSDAPGAKASNQADDGHLTAALIGGGGLLAGGALAMFLARRRRLFRVRRSGRTIASTPPNLVAAEATLRSTGSAGGISARFLDRALRDLSSRIARSDGVLPEVAAVRLGDDRLDLLLASPSARKPPVPWTDDGTGERWTLARDASLEKCDALAPYPALVAIGIADDGATWLLDLEAAGLVQILGDRAACENLARFMGAELALNVWSDDVDVTVAGFAEELVGLNPTRMRCATEPDVNVLIKAARRAYEGAEAMGCDVLGGRMDGVGGDTWMPKILLANTGRQPGDDLSQDMDRFLDELAVQPGRGAVALVVCGAAAPLAGGTTLTVDDERTITLSPWNVRLRANQLPAADAHTLVNILAGGDDADEPMPPSSGTRPFEEVSDMAGAFRVELTEPRDTRGSHGSLLPLADDEYLAAAATTPGDLAALAPRVPRQGGARVLALDESLDEDLAAWSDPETACPRLRLLGPVEVRATGERKPDVDRRCAYYTELVAYLATQDHGATPQQVAEAFHVQTNTLHSRVGIVRKWLGVDPTTGSWYLPESTMSPSGKARGVPVYELVGTLCDADLFKRIRVRAQARGSQGIDDMVAALSLVDGIPFDQLRPGGYGWLADTPLDHYLIAGIVDVAHIVATHALATGDAALALWASQTAIAAAPSEDKPRLDLAKALSALGRTDEADESLVSEVFNRSDDGGPPPMPGGRTTEVLKRAGTHPQQGAGAREFPNGRPVRSVGPSAEFQREEVL